VATASSAQELNFFKWIAAGRFAKKENFACKIPPKGVSKKNQTLAILHRAFDFFLVSPLLRQLYSSLYSGRYKAKTAAARSAKIHFLGA